MNFVNYLRTVVHELELFAGESVTPLGDTKNLVQYEKALFFKFQIVFHPNSNSTSLRNDKTTVTQQRNTTTAHLIDLP